MYTYSFARMAVFLRRVHIFKILQAISTNLYIPMTSDIFAVHIVYKKRMDFWRNDEHFLEHFVQLARLAAR